MNCKKCGRKIPPKASICTYCGQPLERTKILSFARAPQKTDMHHKQSANNLNVVLIVIIAVLALVLLVGAVIYFYNETFSHSRGYSGGGGGGGVGNISGIYPGMPPKNHPPEPPKKGDERNPPKPEIDVSKENAKNKAEAKSKYDAYKSRAEKLTERLISDYEGVVSPTERDKVAKTLYNAWDKLLNDIYDDLEVYMTEEDFKTLEQEELSWIREKESAVQKVQEENVNQENVLYLGYLTATEKTKERVNVLLKKFESCVIALP